MVSLIGMPPLPPLPLDATGQIAPPLALHVQEYEATSAGGISITTVPSAGTTPPFDAVSV